MVKRKILIVDDNRFFCQIVRDYLEDHFHVFETTRGEETISLADQVHPDLVLLDIEMQGCNGIDICKQLKDYRQTQKIPVILLSSRAKKTDIVLGLQAGADDYLTKPINQPDLLARIDAHLNSRKLYAGLEHRDLVMLLELFESVSVMRNPMNILRMIVERIGEVVDVSRCSIVAVRTSGNLIVKASSDLEGDREIQLENERYPEITMALETGRAVVVNDIRNDPLMAPVRQYVSDLAFHSIIVVPIVKKKSVIGTFFLRTASDLKVQKADRIYNLCHIVANISANALENAVLFGTMKTALEFLEEASIRDGLTKLFTHRHFYDRLDEEFSRSRRHREPLSLIFCDIDDFKRINDTFGHIQGDEVLRGIGTILKGLGRESDVTARYGGEEFAVLLPNTSSAGAMEMAHRLISAVRKLTFKGQDDIRVSVSVGVSTYTNDNLESGDQLVELADWALYQAKAAGKDRAFANTDLSLPVKSLPKAKAGPRSPRLPPTCIEPSGSG